MEYLEPMSEATENGNAQEVCVNAARTAFGFVQLVWGFVGREVGGGFGLFNLTFSPYNALCAKDMERK